MAMSDSFAAPDQGPQKGELALSEDQDFAADGKVMMLVLVLLFASLFIFLMVFLCMKHRRIHTHAHGLHRHKKPAEHSGLHPSIQLPTANQVKGHSADLHNMNAHQTV